MSSGIESSHLLLSHLLLVLACTTTQEAPASPAAPKITDLVVQAPSSAKVGDKITAQVSYTLSEGCWETHTKLSQPSPLALTERTVHTENGADCVSGESSSVMQIPLTESGAFTWSVILDGETVSERTIQVEPAQ